MPVRSQYSIKRLAFWVLVIFISIFSFINVHAAQVTLAWDSNNPVPDGYQVFARLEGQKYDYSSPVWPQSGDDPTLTTCSVDNLADGTSYYFIVRAYVGNTFSGDSNEINYITESAALTVFTLSSDAGDNGAISPGSAQVNAGENQTFSITPDPGYMIGDVLVDGVSVGPVASYTFSQVDADHAIRAVFSALSYTVTASAQGYGAVSPSGSVKIAYNGSQTFLFTPQAGAYVADVRVDGQSVGPAGSYTFTGVDADHSITAAFAADSHTIVSSAGSGGNISPSGTATVSDGASTTFTIVAQKGYRIADVVVDGASVGAVTSYTFPAVDRDHVITASFTADAFTLSAIAGTGGTISPSGDITVPAGGSYSFSIAAKDGYELEDLKVDGNSVGAAESYTFQQVDADHAIEAHFKEVNQIPVADAGPDQVVDESATVTLSGLNSKDMDDGIAAFQWRQLKGSPVNLSSSSEESVSFMAPNVDMDGEALEFELTITDYNGAQASDRCIVNVTWVNEPPVAHTGADQSVGEGSTVVLDAANSTDSDDGIASYKWRQLKGPEVALSNSAVIAPSFSTPDVNSSGTSLVFELTVTDAGGLLDTDNCTVTVTWDNMEPVADAGPDKQVTIGSSVILDGSGSMDPDGQDLKYQWRQTFGPPVTLSDATAVSPIVEIPMNDDFEGLEMTFELTVEDSGGLQGVDTCEILIQAGLQPEPEPADTIAPTVTIESPSSEQVTSLDNRITITGSAYDAGGVEKVVWSNDRGGSGQAEGTTQWRIEDLKLYRGYNTITITAFDDAGNQQSNVLIVHRWGWWYR